MIGKCRLRAVAFFALSVAACSRVTEDQEQPPLPASLVALDRLDIVDGKGIYTSSRDGQDVRVTFSVPLDRVDPARRHDSERVGATVAGEVVLIDRYATRLTGGKDDSCSDGRESFIRVFSLSRARQLFVQPLESCRDHRIVREPAVTWLDEDKFRIETPPVRTYAIIGDRVRTID